MYHYSIVHVCIMWQKNLLHKIQSLLHSCRVFYSWKVFSLPPVYLGKNKKWLKISFLHYCISIEIPVWASTGLILENSVLLILPGVWTPPTNLCADIKIASLYTYCWSSLLINTYKQVYFIENNTYTCTCIRISTKLDMHKQCINTMLYITCYMSIKDIWRMLLTTLGIIYLI